MIINLVMFDKSKMGRSSVLLIKAIRALTGLGLRESKEIHDLLITEGSTIFHIERADVIDIHTTLKEHGVMCVLENYSHYKDQFEVIGKALEEIKILATIGDHYDILFVIEPLVEVIDNIEKLRSNGV